MRGAARRAVLAGALPLCLGGCIQGEGEHAVRVAGGDADRGRELVYAYACGSCHVIPGVAGANALAGPPLTDWTERAYVAGAMWNTPDNVVAFLVDPQRMEPGTAMPDLGVTEEEARHMAAYLFTLGDRYDLGPPHPFPRRWLEALGAKEHDPRPWSAPIDTEHTPAQGPVDAAAEPAEGGSPH